MGASHTFFLPGVGELETKKILETKQLVDDRHTCEEVDKKEGRCCALYEYKDGAHEVDKLQKMADGSVFGVIRPRNKLEKGGETKEGKGAVLAGPWDWGNQKVIAKKKSDNGGQGDQRTAGGTKAMQQ